MSNSICLMWCTRRGAAAGRFGKNLGLNAEDGGVEINAVRRRLALIAWSLTVFACVLSWVEILRILAY